MRLSQLSLVSSLATTALALWPAPQSFTNGTSALWFQSNVKVTYNGRSVNTQAESSQPASQNSSSLSIIDGAVQRTLSTIQSENFIPWKLYPRDAITSFEPTANGSKTFIDSLAITQTSTDNATTLKPLAGEVDESYTLCIETNGTATITAVSYPGVLHALNSFTQLFYTHSQKDAGIYMNTAPVKITDAPKFSHRGLNMDVSRNWYPKKDILRQIDAISWNKFNRFHIHMTDSQSWPIEIPSIPELAQKGAYNPGLYYTTQDLQDIQSYAQERGVEVIIEFDMPGHTTSIGRAFPDLIAAYDQKPWGTYCNEPPCGQLKLNSSDVDTFLEKLFDDILPRVSPYSTYFHTGGDEVNVQAILLDPTVASNESAVIKPYLQRFLDRNHKQVRAAGLTPVVWEEMITTWNLTLGEDVLVQTWISPDSVSTVTSAGHKVLFGQSDFWYLDCGHGQWLDFTNGASFQSFYPFPDYCSPYKNWKLVYSYDPLANLTAEQAKLVVGGEVHIWSETTDGVNLDTKVWPRASAAGEVMWSGRQDATGQNRSQLDASPRLAEMRERLVARGVSSGPVQMIFLLEARLEQASVLKKVVDAIKDLVQDCNFDCNDSGIALQAMDNSHVALVSMMLKAEGFSPYRCDRNIALGVNLTSLTKVLRAAQGEDILTLKAEDAPDVLNLVFESSESDRLSEYDLKLMDIDQEHLGIPETEYAATISMPSAEFKRICTDLLALSESVAIEATKDGVSFKCTGDIGNGAVTLRSHTNVDKPQLNVDIELAEPVALTFSLKYLTNFCKASALSDTVKLCLSNEVPLLVEYPIANSSHLRFYLAPKIGDEE